MQAATSQVRAAPHVLSEVVDGDVVLLNLDTGFYFSLNSTGARLWELLQTPVDVAEARRVLQAEYEAEPEQIAQDVETLMGQLLEHGLAEQVTTSA